MLALSCKALYSVIGQVPSIEFGSLEIVQTSWQSSASKELSGIFIGQCRARGFPA